MRPEGEIITYEELRAVPVSENGEPLVDVRTFDPNIVARYEKMDMVPFTGNDIFVRETLARKLATASSTLQKSGHLRLRVAYGYRHPEVQQKYFGERREKLRAQHPSLSEEALDALTHNFVAVPSVAGHPTGGAVDITIIDTAENDLDMGTRIADWSEPEKIKTFANDLSDAHIKNRRLLHDALIEQGLAPFYGEWWHFSYGDREWACFYGKPTAIYTALEYTQ
jgi:D-alanyl-D-alanine dipeptidase